MFSLRRGPPDWAARDQRRDWINLAARGNWRFGLSIADAQKTATIAFDFARSQRLCVHMMGNIYRFYGDQEDVLRLWRFISDLPQMQFVEEFSQPNCKNRQFDEFPGEKFFQDGRIMIAAWPSVAGGQPRQRIDRLSPESAAKLRASGKCVLESPAFIRMTTGHAPNDKLIGPRELFYWTEKAARRYGKSIDFDEAQIEDVDWAQLKVITDKIISYIKRSSEARWRSIPVLPGCASELRAGSKRLWDWGRVGTI